MRKNKQALLRSCLNLQQLIAAKGINRPGDMAVTSQLSDHESVEDLLIICRSLATLVLQHLPSGNLPAVVVAALAVIDQAQGEPPLTEYQQHTINNIRQYIRSGEWFTPSDLLAVYNLPRRHMPVCHVLAQKSRLEMRKNPTDSALDQDRFQYRWGILSVKI